MQRLLPMISICLLAISYADVMYEMETDYEGMLGISSGHMGLQVFVKGDKARISMSIDSDGEISNSVSIIRFDLMKFWLLDEDNKEYEEIMLNDSIPIGSPDTFDLPMITVFRTGDTSNILDLKCEKIIVSMQDSSDGSFLYFSETLWVSSEVPGYEELKNFTDRLTRHGLRFASASLNGNENAVGQLQEKINEIDGFPLKFSLDVQVGIEDMTFIMTSQSHVVKLDEVPIHDRVFDLPEGFVEKNDHK
jgi:hypothetical protein